MIEDGSGRYSPWRLIGTGLFIPKRSELESRCRCINNFRQPKDLWQLGPSICGMVQAEVTAPAGQDRCWVAILDQ